MYIIIFDICKTKQKIERRERDRLNVFFIVHIYCACCVIFIEEIIIINRGVYLMQAELLNQIFLVFNIIIHDPQN